MVSVLCLLYNIYIVFLLIVEQVITGTCYFYCLFSLIWGVFSVCINIALWSWPVKHYLWPNCCPITLAVWITIALWPCSQSGMICAAEFVLPSPVLTFYIYIYLVFCFCLFVCFGVVFLTFSGQSVSSFEFPLRNRCTSLLLGTCHLFMVYQSFVQ